MSHAVINLAVDRWTFWERISQQRGTWHRTSPGTEGTSQWGRRGWRAWTPGRLPASDQIGKWVINYRLFSVFVCVCVLSHPAQISNISQLQIVLVLHWTRSSMIILYQPICIDQGHLYVFHTMECNATWLLHHCVLTCLGPLATSTATQKTSLSHAHTEAHARLLIPPLWM